MYRKIRLCAVIVVAMLVASCGNGNRQSVVNDVVDTVMSTLGDTATQEALQEPVEESVEMVEEEQMPAPVVDEVAVAPEPIEISPIVDIPDMDSVSCETDSTGMPVSPASKTRKYIALTFDDGPSNNTTPIILDIMQQYGAHCTFFCVGSCITEKTKHNLQRAVSLGCEIGNHTYAHPSMPKQSVETQLAEVNKTNEKIMEAIGRKPVMFRPPYLAYNQQVLNTLELVCIGGLSSDDWVTSKTPEDIVNSVMKLAKDGAIIVMHDLAANRRTPVAMQTLVPRLQAEGYVLVTVSELFAIKNKTPMLHKMYSGVK